MLVVRRREGEAIIVAGDVEISIVEISRTRVKLGITAPRNVSIVLRESVAVASDNRAAATFLGDGALHGKLIRLLGEASRENAQTESGRADM